jgi:hypothetical protein
MTTIEHLGGVGLNGRYNVVRDGNVVATIKRDGRRWKLASRHYDEKIGHFGSVDAARKNATERAAYPTAAEVYESICQRVEHYRRLWKQQAMAAQYLDFHTPHIGSVATFPTPPDA